MDSRWRGRIRTSFSPICGGYEVDTEANQYIHGAMPPEIYDALFVLTAVFTQIKILNYIGFGVMCAVQLIKAFQTKFSHPISLSFLYSVILHKCTIKVNAK